MDSKGQLVKNTKKLYSSKITDHFSDSRHSKPVTGEIAKLKAQTTSQPRPGELTDIFIDIFKTSL